MKKLLVVFSVLFAGIVMFSCSDMGITPGFAPTDDDVILKVPSFVTKINTSRNIDWYVADSDRSYMDQFYYNSMSPALLSFEEDSSFKAGDSFTKSVLGKAVDFTTTIDTDGKSIIYDGKAADDSVLIKMIYNPETERLYYKQDLIITMYSDVFPAPEGFKKIFMEYEFDTIIVNGQIHTKGTFYDVDTDNGCMKGNPEFFAGTIEGKKVAGFCVPGFVVMMPDSECKNFDYYTMNNRENIVSHINGKLSSAKDMPMYIAEKYVDGVLVANIAENGDIIPFMKDGGAPDYEAAQEFCPWTLFPLDN